LRGKVEKEGFFFPVFSTLFFISVFFLVLQIVSAFISSIRYSEFQRISARTLPVGGLFLVGLGRGESRERRREREGEREKEREKE